MPTARHTLSLAAAAASLIGTAQAQEANAWDVIDMIGRNETSSIARLSREEVLAELQRAREEGTYHAGNEGIVPDSVLERRAIAHHREAQRIARAYREEAERLAQLRAQPRTSLSTAPAPARTSPVGSAVVAPMPQAPMAESMAGNVQPSTDAVPADTVQSSSDAGPVGTAQRMSDAAPVDGGAPPLPDVRPNDQVASDRRVPGDAAQASASGSDPVRADATAETQPVRQNDLPAASGRNGRCERRRRGRCGVAERCARPGSPTRGQPRAGAERRACAERRARAEQHASAEQDASGAMKPARRRGAGRYSQPLRRKYQNGVITLAAINASANG